jgi:SAM-dependent methyltransferase
MAENTSGSIPPEIVAHYSLGTEDSRLGAGTNRLEFVRTCDILRRFLPAAPARVLDVGGGPGAYARWLTGAGYLVHLVDPVPLHVEQARAASNGYSVALGDARNLQERDSSADAVLLLGPLYHLTDESDRLKALAEAARVVRPGGLVVAAAISRFAALLDGLWRDRLDDPEFARIVDGVLHDGRHLPMLEGPGWFTTAYLHHPAELAQEVTDAGLVLSGVLAVEGPGCLMPDFDLRWQDERSRQQILRTVARVEEEPSMLGVSAHLLALAHRRGV